MIWDNASIFSDFLRKSPGVPPSLALSGSAVYQNDVRSKPSGAEPGEYGVLSTTQQAEQTGSAPHNNTLNTNPRSGSSPVPSMNPYSRAAGDVGDFFTSPVNDAADHSILSFCFSMYLYIMASDRCRAGRKRKIYGKFLFSPYAKETFSSIILSS